ncbi:hypothetical protein BD779DRAFT_1663186 [Infundibulicybe gibba]|nr:hypothetical protein BD779DRAFT_1663186 [Infundibulicybe gibba]
MMLEALNTRILETAIQLTSAFEFLAKPASVAPLSDEPRSCIVGARMVELLRSSEHHEDPILVQIAFQTGMAAYSEWMISSWYFENPQNEQLLTEIYERVRESEDQAVAGRWRALTRSHVQRMISDEPDLAMYFIDAFVNVLLAAGVPTRASTLQETISTQFAGPISAVVRAALQLNRAIGEGVTACELEVLYVATDASYDVGTMGDSFGAHADGQSEEEELVLCATDLGLVRSEKIPGEPGQWRDVVLLRPKVVLQSALVEVK